MSQFFVKIFCLTLPKSFVSIPWIFLKTWGIEKFLCIIGGITNFRRNIFVSQCRKILWASLQCFRKIEVSKNFMHKRGYQNFPSKNFCLSVPKIFVRESYCFWKNFWFQKVLWMKARITFLFLKFLVSQCRKISWASPQCFRKIGILRNSMHTRGYHVFPSKLFGLTVPKTFVGIPSMFHKIWGIEKIYA